MPPRPSHILVRPEWLALSRETALEPELTIVDCHHHLWDRAGGQRFLFFDLLADMGAGHDIRATVFVQSRSMYRPDLPEALQPIGEVEFANGVAAQAASGLYDRRYACAGIVGFADLMLGSRVGFVLEALLRAGGGRLRGIRNQTAWHEDAEITVNPVPPRPGLVAHADFAAGARVLPQYGLTLDIFAYHTQLDEVITLADACPHTTIVLDHCGGPIGIGRYSRRKHDVFADWSARMRRIAERPNVRLKLGGLAMRISGSDFDRLPAPPSSARLQEAWAPYILSCIEMFGVDRCMFESNFPVDKGMVTYVSLWNAFKLITAGMTVEERNALFHATACDTYRLDKALLSLSG